MVLLTIPVLGHNRNLNCIGYSYRILLSKTNHASAKGIGAKLFSQKTKPQFLIPLLKSDLLIYYIRICKHILIS